MKRPSMQTKQHKPSPPAQVLSLRAKEHLHRELVWRWLTLAVVIAVAALLSHNASAAESFDMTATEYESRRTEAINTCNQDGYNVTDSKFYMVKSNTGRIERLEIPVCSRVDEEERERLSMYSRGSTYTIDPDSECAYANQYGTHNGTLCGEAAAAVNNAAGTQESLQQAQVAGAGLIQVYNANALSSPNTTQEDLYDTQKNNMKFSMAAAALELGSNLNTASQLSTAKRKAESAARGITSARRAVSAAEAEAMRVAGSGGSRYRERISLTNNLDLVGQEIRADQEAQAAKNADAGMQPDMAVANAERNYQGELRAHETFKANLEGSGVIDSVTNDGFSDFSQFRSRAGRGIGESREIAETAGAESRTAQFQAIGSALNLANSVAAFRRLQDYNNNLQDLTPPLPPQQFPLQVAGKPREAPNIPGASATPADVSPIEDFGEFTGGAPRDRVRGGVRGGFIAPNGVAKSRKSTPVRSSSGGLPGGGGGASQAGSGNKGTPYRGPGTISYDGGGRAMSGAGGITAAGNDTDFQDAIRSLLGEGEAGGENVDVYREVASLHGQRPLDEERVVPEDTRTLFERVKDKYKDVVAQGVI